MYGGGWKNKINISGCFNGSKSISVTGINCTISGPDNEGIYTAIVPDIRYGKAFIKVSSSDKNGEIIDLAIKEFRLLGLPEPSAFFGGQNRGSVGRADAAGIPLITCKIENTSLDYRYEVLSLNVMCDDDKYKWDLPINGNRMSTAIQNKISNTPKVSNIEFYKIKVVDTWVGSPKGAQSFTLTLK